MINERKYTKKEANLEENKGMRTTTKEKRRKMVPFIVIYGLTFTNSKRFCVSVGRFGIKQ